MQNRDAPTDLFTPSSDLSYLPPSVSSDQGEIEENEVRSKVPPTSHLSFPLFSAEIRHDPQPSGTFEKDEIRRVKKPTQLPVWAQDFSEKIAALEAPKRKEKKTNKKKKPTSQKPKGTFFLPKKFSHPEKSLDSYRILPTMPPHLRNGRDLSAEQRLRYRLSPAAEERLRRARVSLTSSRRGLLEVSGGGTFATGDRNSPSAIPGPGNIHSPSLEQIYASAAASGPGRTTHSEQLPAEPTYLPAYETRGIKANRVAVASPPSVQSDPTTGGYLQPDGSYTGRIGNHGPSEPFQRSV